MPHAIQPVLDTLADLIRINSVNPSYAGGVNELEIAEYITRYFRDLNIEVWQQEVHPGRPNVIVRVPGENPERRIVFEAHMDTVSTAGMSIEPWTPELRDGRMYGRGACDTKGGLAAMMWAAASVAMSDMKPACELIFAATMDEEFSYRGVVAFCDSRSAGPVDPSVLDMYSRPRDPLVAELAIIAEPTELKPIVASKGVVRWVIETQGVSAHSSKPHLGINAITQMAKVIAAIEKDNVRLAEHSHPLLGSATCNVGVIRGGTQVNFVPDRCQIELDRRMLPGETHEGVLNHYQELIDQLSADVPAMCAVMQPPLLFDWPLETDPEAAPVVALRCVIGDLGFDATPLGVPFCSDASKFGALGIPSVILGPGSIDQAHAAVEYVECEQVLQVAEIYRRFALEYV